MQGDDKDGERLGDIAGGPSSPTLAFPGEPLAPYSIINFTIALEEQKAKGLTFGVGALMSFPEPREEEDSDNGGADGQRVTSSTDAEGPPVCPPIPLCF